MHARSGAMSTATQPSQSPMTTPSPPPRPKRMNPFKRSTGSSGALSSGSNLLARITGTSTLSKGSGPSTPSITTSPSPATGSSSDDAASEAHSELNNIERGKLERGLGQPVVNSRTSSSSPPLPLMRSSSAIRATASSCDSEGPAISHLPEHSSDVSANNFSRPLLSPTLGVGKTASTLSVQSASSAHQMKPESLSDSSRVPTTATRGNSVSEQGDAPRDDHMVAQAAQLILEAARKQAQAETRKKGKSAPASPKTLGPPFSPVNSRSTGHSENPITEPKKLARSSSRSRSKSDAGLGKEANTRKGFFRNLTGGASRDRKMSAPSNNTSREMRPSGSDAINDANASSGTATPGGRRRRFVDTRDIDLLIRELAAEAIAEQVPQPPFARASRSGSSSPLRSKAANAAFHDPRRRSFPSILEDAPMQDPQVQPMSPVSMADNEAFPSADWDAESTSGPAISQPTTPRLLSDDPAMSTVPLEMFTGLGGSPYPNLPHSSASPVLDTVDTFGNVIGHDISSFDASSVSQVNTPRRPSASASTHSSTRRPVLTMTMNDPEAELQGLTRPPKSKKSTPFASRAASRAGSRAASPRASFSNLRQEAEKLKMTAEANKSLSKFAASQAEAQANSRSVSPSSVPAGQASVTRFSSIFRPSKKTQQGKAGHEESKAAQSPTTSNSPPSTYASPSAELRPLSPVSAAVSTHSDTDVSPVAFRVLDLPSENTNGSAEPTNAIPGPEGSLRSNAMAEQSDDAAAPTIGSKKGIRKLLRRLSSFGSNNSAEDSHGNSTKANFPDNSTMPIIDHKLLKKLNAQKDDRDTSATSVGVPDVSGTRASSVLNSHEHDSKAAQATLGLQESQRSMVEAGRSSQERRSSPHLARATSRTPSSEDSVFQSSDNSYSSGRESAGVFKQGSDSAMSEELDTPEVSSGYLPSAKRTEDLRLLNSEITGERTPLARNS